MITQKSDNENRMSAVDILDIDSKKQEYEAPKLTGHGGVAEITKAVAPFGDDGIAGNLFSIV